MLPGLYITFAASTPVEFLQTASNLVETPPVGSEVDESEYLSPYFRILNASASRHVKLLRDHREICEIDLPAILRKGEAEPDVFLQDGDVLYIPEVKRPVIVRGGVVKPGKYEVDRGESLSDVILMAGGSVSDQFLSKVTVERATDFGSEKFDIAITRDYRPLVDGFELRPGDIVRIPEVANFVYVLGGVFTPDAYDYKEGWGVVDYLGQAGGPIQPGDFASVALIKKPGTADARSIQVNMKDVVMGQPAENPVVEPGDIIFVPFENRPWTGPGITGTILQFATFARFLWD
jgi:protein involved in polysaccharide export with SLBB domain